MLKFWALFALMVFTLVAAESVRETETIDALGISLDGGSGSIPDDEDVDLESDSDDDDDYDDEFSGSGDDFERKEEEEYVGITTSQWPGNDNRIPDEKSRPNEIDEDGIVAINEVALKENPRDDLSNNIPMASRSESIFERTEILAAVIAGCSVGLLFAILLIVLLIYRMKKKDEGSYETGKNPIYKKAPTNEFYA
ncbi:syndecan-4 [Latimeria chalumnae]|uniref:Syndecan n=1 Tax=Latimeria chalumnae TaxID=7897 RepID=H3APX5_LATCH|nr:PREDICTED: syndecan-4 [Latimeria chalumnae]|eukprot:XP_006007744.1 PREDICTED: syndecan-4 [Latimeria chalumnae]